MRYHRRSVLLAAAICLVADAVGGVAAHADAAAQPGTPFVQPTPPKPTPPPVKGETGAENAQPGGRVCGPPYVTGDPDLGPTILPRTGYLGALLRGYVPLGGLSPQHFLSRYWDYVENDYRFPPDAGFGRSGNYPNGRLLVKATYLLPGMKLDRFGSNAGAFLSPLGDAFTRRALPPRNLNTNSQDPQHLCNYHAFEVLMRFRVESGPAAPAFEQPGGGTQYHVVSKLIPQAPQTNAEVPVSWLLQNGYLKEIEPVLLPAPRTDHDTSTSGMSASGMSAGGMSASGMSAGGMSASGMSAGDTSTGSPSTVRPDRKATPASARARRPRPLKVG